MIDLLTCPGKDKNAGLKDGLTVVIYHGLGLFPVESVQLFLSVRYLAVMSETRH